jgi:hypothetical protein
MKPALALTATLLLVAAFSTQALPPAPPLTGEVVESRDVQGYTYLRIKTASGETWAAVPTSVVKVGSQVGIANPVTMQNFESKTLNKRFDKIVFGQIVDPLAKPAAPASAAPASASAITKVTKAVGPDARTVAEVVTGKAGLKDKTVLVHGQVVKASTGILGKNWLHLRDGSLLEFGQLAREEAGRMQGERAASSRSSARVAGRAPPAPPCRGRGMAER